MPVVERIRMTAWIILSCSETQPAGNSYVNRSVYHPKLALNTIPEPPTSRARAILVEAVVIIQIQCPSYDFIPDIFQAILVLILICHI